MKERFRFHAKIDAPYLPDDSLFDRFLNAHRGGPWPTFDHWYRERRELSFLMSGPFLTDETNKRIMPFDLVQGWGFEARASELYNRYVDEAEAAESTDTLAPGESVLPHRDFGLALQARGFTADRDDEGRFYPGLSVKSRRERAEQQARGLYTGPILTRLRDEAKERHVAEYGHRSEYDCDHAGPVIEIGAGISLRQPVWWPEADDALAAFLASDPDYEPTVARYIARYFPPALLDWRPGDPDPVPTIEAAYDADFGIVPSVGM